MFDFLGGKLKITAIVFFIVDGLSSVIGFAVLAAKGFAALALGVLIGGLFMTWIVGAALYILGDISETVDRLRSANYKLEKKVLEFQTTQANIEKHVAEMHKMLINEQLKSE